MTEQRVEGVAAEVDLDRLERNFHEVQRRAGSDVKVIAAIKGNAYGHGAVEIGRTLVRCGAHALATGRLDEAIAMREAGIDAQIIMFGAALPDALPALLQHRLTPTVHNLELAQALQRVAEVPMPVHVKLDSGLGRLGITLAEARPFFRQIAGFDKLYVEGVYSHVPFADTAGKDWAGERIRAFEALVDELRSDGIAPPIQQIRASAHLLTGMTDSCNAVCVGHLLYGLSPVLPELAKLSGFQPIFRSLKAKLIHVGRHPAGARIWVGGALTSNAPKATGVLPIGLCDGLPQVPAGGPRPQVVLNGRPVAVLGVSLEHCVLDLGEETTAKVGDEAVFFDDESGDAEAPLPRMAASFGRSPFEMLMSLSGRVPYAYRNSADDIWSRFDQQQ